MKSLLSILWLLTVALSAFSQKQHSKFFNNLNSEGVILDGYDPVDFFTTGKPVKGDARFRYNYEGAGYLFSSQEHLDLFRASPEKYKPQYGGWCAYAVSLGRVAPIDVSTFSIVNGRLFLQHNQRAVAGWNKDVAGSIAKADKYWPAVEKSGGTQIRTDEENQFLNNIDEAGVALQGYDPVAYIQQMKAVKGSNAFTARYNGATYWFSSPGHADTFKENPDMFTPQYGGFCGYAMSLGKLRPIDPLVFDVIEGRLILQHTKEAYHLFHEHLQTNISKADDNWPKQVRKHAGKKLKYDKPAKS